MTLTPTEQDTLVMALLDSGIHYLLHNGHLAERYVSIPFGHKKAALCVTSTESGGAGNNSTDTLPQEGGAVNA